MGLGPLDDWSFVTDPFMDLETRPERPHAVELNERRARMAQRKRRAKRDVERDYPPKQFVAKLRRLADCIEQGKRFRIQVSGERVSVPPGATISIEHERGSAEEEIELQLKWPTDA